jgi:hypothetical protein
MWLAVHNKVQEEAFRQQEPFARKLKKEKIEKEATTCPMCLQLPKN